MTRGAPFFVGISSLVSDSRKRNFHKLKTTSTYKITGNASGPPPSLPISACFFSRVIVLLVPGYEGNKYLKELRASCSWFCRMQNKPTDRPRVRAIKNTGNTCRLRTCMIRSTSTCHSHHSDERFFFPSPRRPPRSTNSIFTVRLFIHAHVAGSTPMNVSRSTSPLLSSTPTLLYSDTSLTLTVATAPLD